MTVTESHHPAPDRHPHLAGSEHRRSAVGRRWLDGPGARVVRTYYGSIAVVLATTLIAQCVLTHREGRSLINTFSYFTIQSNVLVLVAATVLALRPDVAGAAWRVLRLGSLTGITVTGLVYATVLARYVHLIGWAMVYNCVFHYAMPTAGVVGFVLVGPRLRLLARDLVFMVWPVLWLAYTMIRGAWLHPEFTGFAQAPSHYPYEFLDVDRVSLIEVGGSIAFLSVLLAGVGLAYVEASRRLVGHGPDPRSGADGGQPTEGHEVVHHRGHDTSTWAAANGRDRRCRSDVRPAARLDHRLRPVTGQAGGSAATTCGDDEQPRGRSRVRLLIVTPLAAGRPDRRRTQMNTTASSGRLPAERASRVSSTVAGTDPGQRQLNGPQTTGRSYRNLSEPTFTSVCDEDVQAPMRDGVRLFVDVHRPAADGRYPVLVSASPYPRQIQDLGAPMGFIEAGASDFWVPRGYVHVIANVRGTGGSEGTYTMADEQERHDMHDLVEWAAAQPWSDGNVGMIGISYFATTQIEAAVEHPEHLKAIFPVALSPDLYEAVHHHGLFSSGFMTPFVSMIGMTSGHGDELWRGRLANTARHILKRPRLHAKFATMNGEASITILKEAMKLHHDPHPWDDIWRATAVEHPVRDDYWAQRNTLPALADVDIPVYLGCDWQNVPLHLPGTFTALRALAGNPNVRVGLLDEFGLTWPWESLHVEALAWFDHWLKGHDTGIMDGPPIRYALPGADEWRASQQWPPPDAVHQEHALRADGGLSVDEGDTGSRQYMTLGGGLGRVQPSPTDPPSRLWWTTAPLRTDLDVIGDIELRLDAIATAADTAWIATLQDVAPDGTITDVTAGWLRATLREVDEATSRPGAPALPCRRAIAVPVGEVVEYRIPLVPSARRFAVGHSIRLVITSGDQDPETPAIMGFRHATVGTSSLNTILSSSRLLLPVVGCTGPA